MKSFNEFRLDEASDEAWKKASHVVAARSSKGQAEYFEKHPERRDYFKAKHPEMTHFKNDTDSGTSAAKAKSSPKVDTAKKAEAEKKSLSAYGATRGAPVGGDHGGGNTSAPVAKPGISRADAMKAIRDKLSSSSRQKELKSDQKKKMTGHSPTLDEPDDDQGYEHHGFRHYSEELEQYVYAPLQEGGFKEMDTNRQEDERLAALAAEKKRKEEEQKKKQANEGYVAVKGMPFTAAERALMARFDAADKKRKEEEQKKKEQESNKKDVKEEAIQEESLGDHAKLRAYADKRGGMDREDFHTAANYIKSGNHADLKRQLDRMDTEPRDKVLDHVNKAHWGKLGYKPMYEEAEQVDEAIKLNSKVQIHAPGKSYHGQVGHVGEIRHGAHATAPKTYTVDYGDGKSIQLDKKNVKLHKEEVQQVAEATQAKVSVVRPVRFTITDAGSGKVEKSGTMTPQDIAPKKTYKQMKDELQKSKKDA